MKPLSAGVRLACVPAGLLLVLGLNPAFANGPEGGQVVGGQGSINKPDSNTTNIHQQSHKMVIDWTSFNVPKDHTVNFNQPSSKASALNRIYDQNPSQIYGTINANGQVLLVNPNGVFFSPTASVNVNSLVASGLDIRAEDFMAGRYEFFARDGGSGGPVVNQGVLQAANGGSINLIGGSVSNEGLIIASAGQINLVAGDRITMDFDGDGLMRFTVDQEVLQNAMALDSAVSNTGEIHADGGMVLMSGRVAQDIFTHVVNNEGVVRAGRIENDGGTIRLVGSGGSQSSVINTGTLDASAGDHVSDGGTVEIIADTIEHQGVIRADSTGGDGGTIKLIAEDTNIVSGDAVISATSVPSNSDPLSPGGGEGQGEEGLNESSSPGIDETTSTAGTGGTVHVLGDKVALLDNSMIDVSGEFGGGTVLIGGDFQGKNPDIKNASATAVAAGTSIHADAITNGDGGTVVVWSDGSTKSFGAITARGGAEGGDGGLIETSGSYLDVSGRNIDASAPNGAAGLWLIDPYNVTISDNASDDGGFSAGDPNLWTPSASGSNVNTADIVTRLESGTNVEITTTGAGSELGNITVLDPIIADVIANTTLTLTADSSILINASIQSTLGALNLVLNADANGMIGLSNGADLLTAGGNITFNGGGVYVAGSVLSEVNTGGGNIDFNGQLAIANSAGFSINSGGGDITFNGAVDSGNNYEGVFVAGGIDWASALAAAQSGAGDGVGDTYLATITSAFENAIAGAAVDYQPAWLGGERVVGIGTDATWRWVAGPEGLEDGGNGRPFFEQNTVTGVGGTPIGGAFTNWNTNEPNNWTGGSPDPNMANANETALQFVGTTGVWNDLPSTGTNLNRYVVETNAAPSSLTIDAGAGTVTFNDTVGTNKPLSSLSVTADTIAIDGGAVTTTGTQTYNGSVTVGFDTTFTTNNLDLIGASTINAASQALTIVKSGDADAVFGMGGFVTGAVLEAITADTLTVQTTGAGNLTVDGITSANTVNISGLTTLAATGTGNVTFANNDSTFTNSVAVEAAGGQIIFDAGRTLTSTNGSISLTAGAGGADAISAAGALTLNAANGIAVNSNMTTGGTTTIDADSDDDGTGTFTIAADLVTTDNDLNITAADIDVAAGTLDSDAASTTITASNNGDIGLGSSTGNLQISDIELGNISAGSLEFITTGPGVIAVNETTAANTGGFGTLTLTSASTVTFGAGGSAFQNALDVTGATGITVNGDLESVTGNVDLAATANDITFADGVTVTAGDVLTLSAGGNLTGTGALTLLSANGFGLNQDLTTSGATVINADNNNNSTGTFTIADTFTLSTTGNTLDITAADINLNTSGAINSGAASTTITASNDSNISLGDATGGLELTNAELANITAATLTLETTGAGSVTANNVSTVAATGNVNLNATGTGNIVFETADSTFDQDISANATGGQVTFDAGRTLTSTNGAINLTAGAGGANAISAAGALALNAGNGIVINNNMTTGGLTQFNADSNNDGSGTLTLNAALVTSGNDLNITAADIEIDTTDGSINANDVTITASNGGSIGLGSAVGGLQVSDNELGNISANSLEFITTGAGSISINETTAGNTGGFGPLTLTSANSVTFEAGGSAFANDVIATGATGVTVAGVLTSTTGAVNLTATTNNVQVNAAVSAASTVTLEAEDGALILAAAGDITAGGDVSLTGSSGIQTAGDVTTAGGSVTFNSNTTLTGDIAIDTTNSGGSAGANIVFNEALDGTSDLDLTAGTGDISFNDLVGDTAPLGNVLISSANNVDINENFSATTFTQQAGSGTFTLGTGLTNVTLETTGGPTGISINSDSVMLNNLSSLVSNNQNIEIFTDALDTGLLVTINAGTGDFAIAPSTETRDIEICSLLSCTLLLPPNTAQYDISGFTNVTAASFTIGRSIHTGDITIRDLAPAFSMSVVNGGAGGIILDGVYVGGTNDLVLRSGTGGIDGGGNLITVANLALLSTGDITNVNTAIGTGVLAAETTGGSIDVTNTGALEIGAFGGATGLQASGDVTLENDADITLSEAVQAGAANTASIVTSSGAIIDNHAGTTVTAGNVELVAQTGIATGAGENAELEIAAGNLAATTVSGSLNIANDGALTIDVVGSTTGVSITGGTVGDAISIRANSPLIIDEDVINNSGGNIVLAAEGNTAGDDLIINADITASGGNGNIDLFAGDSIVQTAGTTVSAAGSGNITLLAGTDYNDGTPVNGLATGSITQDDGAVIQSEDGDITLRAPGDIQIALLDANSNDGATAGTVTVEADFDGVEGGLSDNSGAITDADGGTDNDIRAGTVNLIAATGIGGSGTGPAIEVIASTINATNTTSGGIFINSLGGTAAGVDDVNFNSIDAQTTGNIELYGVTDTTLTNVSAENGNIDVLVDAANLMIAAAVEAGGANDINYTTINSGNIVLTGTSTAAGGTIMMDSIGSINGSGLVTASTVDLDAVTGIGDTIPLNLAASTISADTTNGDINIANELTTAVSVTSLTTGSGHINFEQSGGGDVGFETVTTDDGAIDLNNDNGDLTIVTAVEAGGDNDISYTTTTSGNIVLTGTTTATGNTVTMTSAGNITGGGLVTGDAVVLDSATGVGVDAGNRVNTSAGTLAARSRDSGGVFVSETGDVTLAMLNGVTNTAADGDTYDVTAAGTITIDDSVNTAGTGDTRLTTTGADTRNIVLGEDVGNATGDTVLTSAGNITGDGLVTGDAVTLDSATGVGVDTGNRVNTSAGTLAARSTTSGGVFIDEAGDVTLDTLNGVANASAAAYDLFSGGSVTVDGDVTAGSSLDLHASNNITLNVTTLTAGTTLNLSVGGSGANSTLDLGDSTLVGDITLSGGASGTHTLIGQNVDSDWNIGDQTLASANINSGGAAAEFENFANLTGGDGADTFIFDPGVTWTVGIIDGGDGSDTLDFAGYDADISVVLSGAGMIDGFNGAVTDVVADFRNINEITGDAGQENSLTGADSVDAFWYVTGGQSGTYEDADPATRILEWTNFSHLTGGAGNDTFFVTASHIGNIAGGNGNNEYNFLSTTNAVLTGNVIGGTGDDTFNFGTPTTTPPGTDNFTITGLLDGGEGGNNTLNFSGSMLTQEVGVVGSNEFGLQGTTTGIGGDPDLLGSSLDPLAPDFINITTLIGNNQGTLIGQNVDTYWNITDQNQGFFAGTLADALNLTNGTTFSNFSILAGNQQDVFIFQAGGEVQGNINAGVNIDGKQNFLLGSTGSDIFNIVGGSTVDIDVGGAGVITTLSNIHHIDASFSDGVTTFEGGGNTFNIDNNWSGNLRGGDDNDTFVFNGGTVAGTISGGAGGDGNRLDYSNLAGPITVNLETSSANFVTGGFSDIQALSGSGHADDQLIGTDGLNQWTIDGSDTGDVNGFSFEDIANLIGGAGTDIFTLENGSSISGTINGGGGTDEIIGPDAGATFNITGLNSGDIAGGATVANFTSIENLTGGDGDDTFNRIGTGAISGLIDGGDGNDTYDVSGVVGTVTLTLGAGFINIENLVGDNDTLVGRSGVANAWDLTGASSGTITTTIDGTVNFIGFNTVRSGTGAGASNTFTANGNYNGNVNLLGTNNFWNYTAGQTLTNGAVNGSGSLTIGTPASGAGGNMTIGAGDLVLPNLSGLTGPLIIGGIVNPAITPLNGSQSVEVRTNTMSVNSVITTGGDLVLLASEIAMNAPTMNVGNAINLVAVGSSCNPGVCDGLTGSGNIIMNSPMTINANSGVIIAGGGIQNANNLTLDFGGGGLQMAVSPAQQFTSTPNPLSNAQGVPLTSNTLGFINVLGLNVIELIVRFFNPALELFGLEDISFLDVSLFDEDLTLFGVIGEGIALALAQCEEVDGCAPNITLEEIDAYVEAMDARILELERRLETTVDPGERQSLEQTLAGFRSEREEFLAYRAELEQFLLGPLDEGALAGDFEEELPLDQFVERPPVDTDAVDALARILQTMNTRIGFLETLLAIPERRAELADRAGINLTEERLRAIIENTRSAAQFIESLIQRLFEGADAGDPDRTRFYAETGEPQPDLPTVGYNAVDLKLRTGLLPIDTRWF